ncbi:SDR family NAD(P)-dependent oxidoreductase [Halosegnis rubeus]|jgi:NADP-dependent 3-hydroxy acid dehydrogenase YdfG|uniref:SDR family NAD(P)-dependent oxidoreductase n=1 Tax=Halosegnis rubeus TaxID=2212850 RepID=A0A5N5UE21_9EURY|nr:SDR family oxidoreductase [Halosegnis rubeus]KAB7516918.1 SDR family NAD(P)-dependent oxidoreductase [Halosegnis rubeus]
MDTVVITGASRGIGAAIAREYGEHGDRVVCCARSKDALDAVASDVREAGGEAIVQRADVRDEYDMERLMETAAREGGEVDTLFANAGVYHGAPGETPLAEESYSAFDEHTQVNGRGVFAAIREALPHLADDARLLVPSGSIARDASAGFGSYAASKAFAEALVRQFAAELEYPTAVVDPGQVSSELTNGMQGRDPDDVAPMFRWAATETDPEEMDGAVLSLRDWKSATR